MDCGSYLSGLQQQRLTISSVTWSETLQRLESEADVYWLSLHSFAQFYYLDGAAHDVYTPQCYCEVQPESVAHNVITATLKYELMPVAPGVSTF